MQVEIWSDVVCPWCAIGRARLRHALTAFEHADDVRLRWRSFELDPSAPREREGDQAGHLAAKYGRSRAEAQGMLDQMTATAAEEGLTFRFDRARAGNTFDAHRLLHLAADVGERERRPALQDQVKDRLLTGYLHDGEPIGEVTALTRMAVEAGLPEASVAAVLAGDQFGADVRADEERARGYGISGVPFFVINGRYGVSGAQPAEVLVSALRQAWQERSPLAMVGAAREEHDGHAAHDGEDDCTDGSCAL